MKKLILAILLLVSVGFANQYDFQLYSEGHFRQRFKDVQAMSEINGISRGNLTNNTKMVLRDWIVQVNAKIQEMRQDRKELPNYLSGDEFKYADNAYVYLIEMYKTFVVIYTDTIYERPLQTYNLEPLYLGYINNVKAILSYYGEY